MLGVLMEAGLGVFGDVKFMGECLAEIKQGTPNGRIWAQGTWRAGEHYGVKRIPVIKKQAISAYDPRVVEATGITMMATAQGADHTAGNLPRLKTREMEAPAIVAQSVAHQARIAANDSLGLCIFGMSVTTPNYEFITNAINAAHGTSLTPAFFDALGRTRCGSSTSSTAGRASGEGRRAARVSTTEPLPRPTPCALPRRRRPRDVRGPARLSGLTTRGSERGRKRGWRHGQPLSLFPRGSFDDLISRRRSTPGWRPRPWPSSG